MNFFYYNYVPSNIWDILILKKKKKSLTLKCHCILYFTEEREVGTTDFLPSSLILFVRLGMVHAAVTF